MLAEKPHRILVIEDNPTDVSLIKEAFTIHGVALEMTVLTNGAAAIEYLPALEFARKPELIILDLNLPKHDGIEVLGKYRESAALRSVPAIILTSSNLPADRKRAKAIGISAFIQKPMNLPGFLALGERLREMLEMPYTPMPNEA
jgi:CheY-like chemotaxis protein